MSGVTNGAGREGADVLEVAQWATAARPRPEFCGNCGRRVLMMCQRMTGFCSARCAEEDARLEELEQKIERGSS